MFFIIFKEGIQQPRALGGYSVLESAKQAVRDRIKKLDGSYTPRFEKQEDGSWLVKGQDQQYLIRDGDSASK